MAGTTHTSGTLLDLLRGWRKFLNGETCTARSYTTRPGGREGGRQPAVVVTWAVLLLVGLLAAPQIAMSAPTVTNVGVGLATGSDVAFHPVEPLDGGRVAMFVSEAAEGVDLNGDGDALDAVPHVFDPATDVVTNVGIAGVGHMVSVAAGGVAFFASEAAAGVDLNGDGDTDDAVPHVFDPDTVSAADIGLAGGVSGFAEPIGVALTGGELAFLVDETGEGADLNGDGDTSDLVAHVYDPATATATNIGLAGGDPAIALVGGELALLVDEAAEGADLNGDGDTSDRVPHIYDPASDTTTNVGIAAHFVLSALDGGELAFGGSEAGEGTDLNGDGDTSDSVPHIYELATDITTNVGVASSGELIALAGGELAFGASEEGEGQDLNGDGDVGFGETVPHIYDLAAAATTNVGMAGGGLAALNGGHLAFNADEAAEGSDLNGDGDTSNQVPHIFDPASNAIGSAGVASAGVPFIPLDGGRLAFLASEFQQNADLNGDGDDNDPVPHVFDPTTATTVNVGIAGHFGPAIDIVDPLAGGSLGFFADEIFQSADLNGDGNTEDQVPHIYDPAIDATANLAIASDGFVLQALNGGGFVFAASESFQGADFNGDGDTEDLVAHVAMGGPDADVIPPTADADGPYTVDEGSTVTLDATGSSDPDGTIVAYDWTPTGPLDDPSSPTPTFTGTDDATVTMTLTVTDNDGATDSDTTTVTVSNVAPTVGAGADQSATVGDTVNLDPATFTDPGAADTHTATIDWGDGTVEAGTVDQTAHTVAGSHTFTAADTYTVEVCVTDDDTGVGCDTLTVTITEAPNSQPIAVDDQSVTRQGQPVTIDVLKNDSDANGHDLSVTNLTPPANGTVVVNGDESVTYTPDSGFVGTDTFTYTANDGQDDSDPATVTVFVIPLNKLLASDGGSGDRFGLAVAIAGDRIVVGAGFDDDNGEDSGSVYVFEADGSGGWTETTKLTASDGAAGDRFGVSLAMAGDRIAIGSPFDGDDGLNSGSVYVFEMDGSGGWTETTKLTASDGASQDRFGGSVAAADGRIVVGATGDDENGQLSGSVYVFEADGSGGWTETKLTASDGAFEDLFGGSVTAAGDRIAVGAIGDDDNGKASGSVYVFEMDGSGGWTETTKLTASDGAAEDRFGTSLAMIDDRIAVGATSIGAVGGSGSTYVFEANGSGGWTETNKLTVPDGAAGDLFGASVAMSGDWIVVGALGDDDNGPSSGSAYVFDLADTVSPVLTVPSDMTVEATEPDGAVVTFTVIATDDIDPDPTVVCDPPAGSLFPIGDTIVTCAATDDAGNTTTDTFLVTVVVGESTFDGFDDDVEALDLPTGISSSLIKKIEAARQQFANGDLDDAAETLQSLIDQVDALEGKKLTVEEAEQIRTAALMLLEAIT